MSHQEIPTICTDAGKRHDFVFLFDVTNGNPNGDPDADNLPRVDPETMHGIVTDVALKRKIRNYVLLARETNIFIQSKVSLNSLILKAYRDTGVQPPQITLKDEELLDWFESNGPEGFTLEESVLTYGGESNKVRDIQALLLADVPDSPENKELRAKLVRVARDLAAAAGQQQVGVPERDKAKGQLCHDYYDIRMFGAVLATGLNAGQVRGPMQVSFARSVDRIFQHNLTITRQARTTQARMATGGTEMGRKPIVPYGLYRAHGFFSPQLGKTTGVGKQDLALFWEALMGNMWDFDRSAARQEMWTQGLYVFTHDSPLGDAPAHQLFERIRVARKRTVEAPRAFTDYTTEVDQASLPSGVTLTTLVPREGD